jgi:outer membrane protein with beta-barrel domain
MRRALIALMLTALPGVARAQQPPPLDGFDVAASIGLFTADRSDRSDCCSSWSGSLFRGLSGGYYWTDHLKTELELGFPGPTEGYSFASVPGSRGAFVTVEDERTYTGARFSLSQAYQFGRNAMFHPYASAGVDIDRERVDLERRTFGASPVATVETSSSTTVHMRPFAGAGFKAYLSERTFFRGELKLDIADRLTQVVWKAGVGVDFTRRARPAAVRAVDSPSSPSPRGRDPIEIWRAYATQLPIGSIVDVATAGDERIVAEFIDVDDEGIVVKPRTRIRDANRRVPFDRLEVLRLHLGPSPAERFGAVAAGVGAGSGAFLGALMLLLMSFGG